MEQLLGISEKSDKFKVCLKDAKDDGKAPFAVIPLSNEEILENLISQQY